MAANINKRKLRTNGQESSWSRTETLLLLEKLNSHGTNWEVLSGSLQDKSPDDCKEQFSFITSLLPPTLAKTLEDFDFGQQHGEETDKMIEALKSAVNSYFDKQEELTTSTTTTSSISSSATSLLSTDDGQKKRHRRTAAEIDRGFVCEIPNCNKAYGSEGALKMHIRLKHSAAGADQSKSSRKESPIIGNSTTSRENSPYHFNHHSHPHIPHHSSAAPSMNGYSPAARSNSPIPQQLPMHIQQQFSRSNSPLLTHPADRANSPVLSSHHNSYVTPNRSPSPSLETSQKDVSVPILMIKVGPYQKVSGFVGDLTARFFFSEKKFAWEVYISGIQVIYKVEFPFNHISGLGLHVLDDGTSLFTMEIYMPPYVYASPFQPHKAVSWTPAGDFTGGPLQAYRRHTLHFNKGTLNVPLELLLRSEPRLALLAQKGLTPTTDPFFPNSPRIQQQPSPVMGSNPNHHSPVMGNTSATTSPLLGAAHPNSRNSMYISHNNNNNNINRTNSPYLLGGNNTINHPSLPTSMTSTTTSSITTKEEEDSDLGDYDSFAASTEVTLGRFEDGDYAESPVVDINSLIQQQQQHQNSQMSDCAIHCGIPKWKSSPHCADVLRKKFRFACCEDVISVHKLTSHYTCSCGHSYYYCFCCDDVVRSEQQWFCKDCGTCRMAREWHCKKCNKCTFGRSIPCNYCQTELFNSNINNHHHHHTSGSGYGSTLSSSPGTPNSPLSPSIHSHSSSTGGGGALMGSAAIVAPVIPPTSLTLNSIPSAFRPLHSDSTVVNPLRRSLSEPISNPTGESLNLQMIQPHKDLYNPQYFLPEF